MAKSKQNKKALPPADVAPVPGVQSGIIDLANGEGATHIVVIENLTAKELSALRDKYGDDVKLVKKLEEAARKAVLKKVAKAIKD